MIHQSLAHVVDQPEPSSWSADEPMRLDEAVAVLGKLSPSAAPIILTVLQQGHDATARGRPAAHPPRLLNEREAARYLGLPVAAMKRITSGRVVIDGKVRWDRVALDAWLDAESGLRALSPANDRRTDAETALEQWLADATHAARPA